MGGGLCLTLIMTMTALPVRVPETFRTIAHRGASGYAPENTMAAFMLAAQMAATEIELDIQFSKDNQLMICHDPELSRYGHPGKHVLALTRDELQVLDMGAWFAGGKYAGETMPTLDQLFEKFATQFTYHVEIKTYHAGSMFRQQNKNKLKYSWIF